MNWTGFGDFTSPNGEFVRGKTLWDWMQLFIIPIFLSMGVFFLNRSERESDRQQGDERAKVEREIATDRQRENALQSYIDRMADLLLNEKLRTTKNKEVRDVARTRTLSVLRGLDTNRKNLLFQFLVEAKLVSIEKPIIELQGANLSGADLTGAKLNYADLIDADLSGANLFNADLSGTDLSDVNLSGADLGNVNLKGARLCYADLSDADLTCANLSDADLTGTNLSGANLFIANLSSAKVTNEQLEKAKSLKNATMPDGTKHD